MFAEVCAQCGKCTSACPVSKVIEGFNPRHIVSKVALGKINELIFEDAIWTCTSCLKCRERCPEEVSPYDIILVLRNLAYHTGLNYPVGYDDFIRGIKERGFISSPQEVRTRRGNKISRVTLGLPEPSSPKKLNVLNNILDGLLKAGRAQ
jgi:heterodisulfide reductase subunit C